MFFRFFILHIFFKFKSMDNNGIKIGLSSNNGKKASNSRFEGVTGHDDKKGTNPF